MRTHFAALAALLVSTTLVGCGERKDAASETADSAGGAASEAAPVLSAAIEARPKFQADLPIDVGRIGEAAAGMSLAEIEAKLPGSAIRFERDFMVDFSALCFERLSIEVLCAVIDAAGSPDPDAAVVMLTTRSPDVQTAEGVHAGMTIAEAQGAYGPAKVGYHLDNESREYAYFLEGPSGGLYFRVAGPDGGQAGDYAGVEADEGYFETVAIRDGAVITQIDVTAID